MIPFEKAEKLNHNSSDFVHVKRFPVKLQALFQIKNIEIIMNHSEFHLGHRFLSFSEFFPILYRKPLLFQMHRPPFGSYRISRGILSPSPAEFSGFVFHNRSLKKNPEGLKYFPHRIPFF